MEHLLNFVLNMRLFNINIKRKKCVSLFRLGGFKMNFLYRKLGVLISLAPIACIIGGMYHAAGESFWEGFASAYVVIVGMILSLLGLTFFISCDGGSK